MTGTSTAPELGSAELLQLGERYAAMGLTAAATSCLLRAAQLDPTSTAAHRRLVELSLATGRGTAALSYARELSQRDKGIGTRLLTGFAQLAVGELSGARFSFAAVVDAAKATPLQRARAMTGRAKVAEAEGDRPGAAANIMGAAEVVARWMVSPETDAAAIDAQLSFCDEIIRLAVAWDRAVDVGELLPLLEASGRASPAALWRALWLAARQSHGDRQVADRDIDAALTAELEARAPSNAVRILRCERLLRRRFRDRHSRTTAIEELSSLANEISADAGNAAELARIQFLLASAYEDDPTMVEPAGVAYERGLALQPNHALAATRLAALRIDRGDHPGALAMLERALRIDPEADAAWVTAARLAASSRLGAESVAKRLLDAADPGAGSAAGPAVRFANAASAHMRDEVLAGMYARGHRLKNLLGIIGVRARSAQKSATGLDAEPHLADLVTALTALHEEWGRYLRTMQTEAAIETVAVAPLVREVVKAAREMSDVAIDLDIAGATPDLTGDRVLLIEALTNIVVNAVQSCDNGGQVRVSAYPRAAGTSPAVEIRIDDSGGGIPSNELTRVFSPGFTTKEQGSGIGLAVAERVVSAHSGRIHLDSEEGRGTTVTVILPCEPAGLSSFRTT